VQEDRSLLLDIMYPTSLLISPKSKKKEKMKECMGRVGLGLITTLFVSKNIVFRFIIEYSSFMDFGP
jgi:hypothetical protein